MFERTMYFLTDPRNGPKFFSQKARWFFGYLILALLAMPICGLCLYLMMLTLKNQTAEQAGYHIPLIVLAIVAFVQVIGFYFIIRWLDPMRQQLIADVNELTRDAVSEGAYRGYSEKTVFARVMQIVEEDRATREKTKRIDREWKLERIEWKDLSWQRWTAIIALWAGSAVSTVYALLLIFGRVAPAPLPPGYKPDLSTPNGMMATALRNGDMDFGFGLVLIVVSISMVGLSLFFKERSYNQRREALRLLRRDLNI